MRKLQMRRCLRFPRIRCRCPVRSARKWQKSSACRCAPTGTCCQRPARNGSLSQTPAPKNIAIFGSSAGGALTLEMILNAKQDGLPLPGAIAPGTPMSDVTKIGDTFVTNAMLDNVLVSPDGFCDAGTKVYANGHDLKDPLLSPV